MSSYTRHPDYDVKLHNEKCCEGKLCPQCLGTNVKCVGSAPDGMNMNYAYDCLDCNGKWEGY